MSVWLTIPTARPIEEAEACFALWKARNYNIAVWCDPDKPVPQNVDMVHIGAYVSYSHSINYLSRLVFDSKPSATFVIAAGDDVEPIEDRSPAEIEAECIARFGGTLGVMQPTDDDGPYDCCAISPWIGREYALRCLGGKGPYPEALPHYFSDKLFFDIATRDGVYWMRPDLRQRHNHWTKLDKDERKRPEHLVKWAERNQRDYVAYLQMQKDGFPGMEMLPTCPTPKR